MLDERTKQDILAEIDGLAAVYTPEWNFADEKDAGYVLARIFAAQMETTIQSFNGLPEKFRGELTGMLGLKPMKPEPAGTVIVLKPSPGASDGTDIPKGSRFLASPKEDEPPVVFESLYDIHVSDYKMNSIWCISALRKNASRIYGGDELLPAPVSLFHHNVAAVYPNQLWIYHPFLYQGEDCRFTIEFSDARTAELLADKKIFQFFYEETTGKVPVKIQSVQGNGIYISQQSGSQKLIIEKTAPGDLELIIDHLRLYAQKKSKAPLFLHNGGQELNPQQALVLGEELSVYGESYLGLAPEFVHGGVRVVVSFQLEFGRHEVHNTLEPKEELKLVKRRPGQHFEAETADVYAQEIRISYFNGKGFRNLDTGSEINAIFSNEQYNGFRQLEFVCPPDMEMTEAYGFQGYLIKMNITKADYCFYRPARHHYPILRQINVEYHFDEAGMMPQKVIRRTGEEHTDITSDIVKGKRVPIFLKFPYAKESLLIGFDEKPETGPVSIYFILSKNRNVERLPAFVEYASAKGFKPLRAMNHTEDFLCSGTMIFEPPTDMARQQIEGEDKYWIRISTVALPGKREVFPVLEQIYVNAVEVKNIERSVEKEIYLDENHETNVFSIPGNEIIDVEINVYEQGEMRRLNDSMYKLDRRKKELSFDEMLFSRLRRNAYEAAFSLRVISCDGAAGNVGKYKVDSAAFMLRNVEQIFNPLDAAGGCNAEDAESMKRRGKMILGTGNRLVTEQDYADAARAFSAAITKAWCRFEGGAVVVSILMSDYDTGQDSFRQIQEPLRNFLTTNGLTAQKQMELKIREPIFVIVTVELWLSVTDWKCALEERNRILQGIRRLLNSFGDTGQIPREAQMMMMLQTLSGSAWIKSANISARYLDSSGTHISELNRLKEIPSMVCVNGEHEVHILW